VELRQLRYFIAVAEERHFTRAAKQLHVAQSGLSASVRSLERELGAALFVRNTRQVRLTAAGTALLAEARRTVAAADSARDAVAAVQGLVQGSIAVGTLQCLHAVNLPSVLAGFLDTYPGLEIGLRHGGSGELTEQVAHGKLDLAFVSRPRQCPEQVVVTPLVSEPLVLACGPDHPLAARARVDVTDLRTDRFVDFQRDWGTRDVVDALLAAAGVERRVALEVNDVHSLLDLIACGLGVALVPRSFSVKTDRVRFVGLADPAARWETVTVSADPASAAATALLAEVRRAAR
jgi:DNA-binding transcriptional LysR family regulator